MPAIATTELQAMEFPERLAQLRIAHNLTQQQLADLVGVHITQIQRYEKGDSQPALDIIRRIAIALQVSADLLLFDQALGDADDELRRQFEAVLRFDPDEREMAQGLLEALILKHQNKRFFIKPTSANAGTGAAEPATTLDTSTRSKAAKARQRGSTTPGKTKTRRAS